MMRAIVGRRHDSLDQATFARVEETVCQFIDGTTGIPNARNLLEALYRQGVKLYLASGTDEADVIAEAAAMGYAHPFEGRIFGAVGDINVEAKRLVLERIIRDHNLARHEFATFGDGPVEMRETNRRGGLCIWGCERQGFGVSALIPASADVSFVPARTSLFPTIASWLC